MTSVQWNLHNVVVNRVVANYAIIKEYTPARTCIMFCGCYIHYTLHVDHYHDVSDNISPHELCYSQPHTIQQ